MNKRLILAGLAATGGLLTSAFLQTVVAAADPVSATGVDAFTIGNYTFDPYTMIDADTGAKFEGFLPVSQLVGAAPVLALGGGSALGINLAPQSFELYDSTGTDIGSIDANQTVTSLFGLTNTEFTVLSSSSMTLTPVAPEGSVFDVFNLGNGYYNVYSAIPGGLDGNSTVTDTLVTPNGDIDLTPLFGGIDASAPLQPGEAFVDLQAGDPNLGAAAISIGGFTLDPTLESSTTEGFDPVASTVSAPPLLNIGGAEIFPGFFTEQQSFNVLGDSGTTPIGVISTGVQVTNLLGFTNTELIVTNVNDLGNVGVDLPTEGSVYDAFNLGNGYTNLYTAIPGLDGANDSVSDTLITPYGNIDLTPLFGNIDAAAPLDAGEAFAGLPAGDPSIGAEAFTLGGFTFDPILAAGGEGFDPVTQLTGLPPLLIIGGGTIVLQPDNPDAVLTEAPQAFDVYDGTTQLASINTSESVTELLGLTNTQFTITDVTPIGDGNLPIEGSVYDVFNLGNGYANIYTAIPGLDGAPDTIHDTFVTPMGSMNLDALFGSINALGLLDPGAAFAGLDTASDAATAFDPLGFLGL